MSQATHIGVLFSARLVAILFACLGLVAGILYSGIGFFIDLLGERGLNLGTLLAFGALVGMPVVFAVAGFVAGALGAIVFNNVSGLFGGVDLKIDIR